MIDASEDVARKGGLRSGNAFCAAFDMTSCWAIPMVA